MLLKGLFHLPHDSKVIPMHVSRNDAAGKVRRTIRGNRGASAIFHCPTHHDPVTISGWYLNDGHTTKKDHCKVVKSRKREQKRRSFGRLSKR